MKYIFLIVNFLIVFYQGNLCAQGSEYKLYEPGKERVVNYTKYGKFEGIGTPDYKYIITDKQGLAKAVGEGIYPCSGEIIYNDPLYKQLLSEGRLKGHHWERCGGEDPMGNFFVWAIAHEAPGVKLFYEAIALERAGLYEHAIKALYAIIIHYPDSIGWAIEQTFVWYIAPAAMDIIGDICDKYPELELKLVDCEVHIESFGDTNTKNDIIIVNPGRFIRYTARDRAKEKIDLSTLKIVERKFGPKVQLIKYENKHWQLLVDGEPFIIKALTYGTCPSGQSAEDGTLEDWMYMDYNKNGKADGPYDSWVDKNRNNIQDTDELAIGDFQLMKDMGVNVIRLYHHASNKELLRDLYNNYGIMVMLGDFLGMYGVGSGAGFDMGTDYNNPVHRKKMLASVAEMVLSFRDEPYVLCWVLGNENDYSIGCNVKKKPKLYYKFVNEAAKVIHRLDPTRPVVISNGTTDHLRLISKYAPQVDIFMINAYWGSRGFGNLWKNVAKKLDRPLIIGEFGCPAYHEGESQEVAESEQAYYLRGCWENIMNNAAGSKFGNALGGVVYEWMDEWWLSGVEPAVHNLDSRASGPFPDGWGHSEWFGICGQGDGKNSPFLREIRQSYYTLQELWTGKERIKKGPF